MREQKNSQIACSQHIIKFQRSSLVTASSIYLLSQWGQYSSAYSKVSTSLRNTFLQILHANTNSIVFFSSWSEFSLWQSEQSNHFLQQGALMAAWTFKMCLHIQIDLIFNYIEPKVQWFVTVCMGQQPSKKKDLTEKVFAHVFESDPRLTEQVFFLPELFSGLVDIEIKNVEKLKDSLPIHTMQGELIDGIHQRFTLRKDNPSTQQDANPNQKNKKKGLNQIKGSLYELGDIERFFGVLKKIQQSYQVGKQLDKIVSTENIGKKITVRKKVQVNYTSCLNKVLYARGYLYFYLILLRKHLTSRDSKKKEMVNSFHNNIGRMICQMIEHNHLGEDKMLQLFFKMVIVDKEPEPGASERQLTQIKDQFWPLYLKKEHSLTLDPAYCQDVRQVSRCYLDELYLRSIKEAQDPDIIVQANEGLGIVRNFPILRVKEKNR